MSTEQSSTPENNGSTAPDDLPPPPPSAPLEDTPPPAPSAPAEDIPPPPPSSDASTAPAAPIPSGSSGKDKKILAGVMGILFGGLGIHKFILGYTTEAVIQLIVGLVILILSCGALFFIPAIFGLVEGIIYLTKSDEEFERIYIQGRKGWL